MKERMLYQCYSSRNRLHSDLERKTIIKINYEM